MRIHDTADEAAYRHRVREWIDAEGRKLWRPSTGHDLGGAREWVRALHQVGLVGVTWPTAYGGQALTAGHETIIAQELAASGTPIPTSMGVGLNMVAPTLLVHGSAEQQSRLLPAILSGQAVWCEGFSEPEAGSDLAALRTRGRLDDDGSYRIDGQKVWCSFAHLADSCLLLVRTGALEQGRAALTCFHVPMNSPGITVRPLRQMSGDSEFSEVFLDDVVVPAEAIIGGLGRGWAVAMTTLFYERSRYHDQLAAFATNVRGLARRVSNDPVLSGDARVLSRLGGVWTDLAMVRATMLRLGEDTEAGLVLKLLWTSALDGLTSLAMDVLGPLAMVESPDETVDGRSWQQQLFLYQMWSVAAGSTEIARSVVAERALHLPRSR